MASGFMDFAHRQKCFCAFCKSERAVYTKRRINMLNVFGAALGACVFMYVFWQQFDPRVVLMFIAFLGMSECFVQIRWRMKLVCKECGFDPVLYLKDSDKASAKVRAHLERRKEDPASLFKAPLNLTVLKKAATAKDAGLKINLH